MQYRFAAVAFALGASAAPQWPPACGYGEGIGAEAPAGGVAATGSAPVATGISTATSAPVVSQGYVAVADVSSSSASSSSSTETSATSESTTAASATPVSSSAASSAAVTAAPSDRASLDAVSGGKIPASSGSTTYASVSTIAAGESFDGGMMMIDRGVDCTGQEEGGSDDTVFTLEEGATLSNVIIGPNQLEGIHCYGACTLENVWWSSVCEDAFTIKEQGAGDTTYITGGGAFGAEDKVLQHNGGGTLDVSGFTVDDFGKLYRSCGNCDGQTDKHVIMDDITASSGKTLVGINSNLGDTATLTNINVSDVGEICQEYEGNDDGSEPEETTAGPSSACIYEESDITGA